MQQIVNIDKYYVRPPINYKEIIKELSLYRREDAPVKADLSDWDLSDCYLFDELLGQLNVIYPSQEIEDLWISIYRPGDYAEAHNHNGSVWAFVWYLDACPECSPLVFPDIKHPWLPPEVVKPKVGNLHVFDGEQVHYVPPHTCSHDRIIVAGNLVPVSTSQQEEDFYQQALV